MNLPTRTVLVLFALSFSNPTARSQNPSAPTETFEVASVKPYGPQSVRGSGGGPGTKILAFIALAPSLSAT